jgi:hypothetical protein
MKLWKILAALVVLYVVVVAAFESLLGWYQPQGGNTVVITTTDDSGATRDRVVSRLDSDGKLYVAANHWPRAWYRHALERPEVQVAIDGQRADYTAVAVTPEEHERLQAEFPHSLGFRVLTGFPPRRFVRLDPN